jgi:hypothetical protein
MFQRMSNRMLTALPHQIYCHLSKVSGSFVRCSRVFG